MTENVTVSSSSTTGADVNISESESQLDEKFDEVAKETSDLPQDLQPSEVNDDTVSKMQDSSPDGDTKARIPGSPVREDIDESSPTEEAVVDKVNSGLNSELPASDCGNINSSDDQQNKRRSSDTEVTGVAKKIHVEIEKPAVEAGHGYLNSMDITSMSYDEYLAEFRALQERSKAKFQSAQQQLRQLQQHQRQHQQHHHQHFQHQNRMQQQNMNFNGNVNMAPPPMMGGGGMGGPPGGGPPPMGNMQHHMGMGPGPQMGARW